MPAPEHPAVPRRAPRRRLRLAARYGLLTLGAFVVLFPLYIAIVNSLLEPSQVAHQPPPLVPIHPQWSNYSKAWTSGNLGTYLRNSGIQTVIIVERAADHVDPRRLCLRVPRVPVQADTVRRLPDDADDPL